MTSQKAVTRGQADQVRKLAHDKGISREQFQLALDNGSFSRYLDTLRGGNLELIPPPNARIHILRVSVVLDRDWQYAVKTAGPDTPASYNVWKVGDLYLPTGTGKVEKEIILLNYPKGADWKDAIAWGDQQGLVKTVPRDVFAIGEQFPNLHRELGMNPIYVVGTTECSFDGHRRACIVWWGGSGRGANLRWLGYYGSSFDWFAFSREVPQN